MLTVMITVLICGLMMMVTDITENLFIVFVFAL